jgi:hypothetical protein
MTSVFKVKIYIVYLLVESQPELNNSTSDECEIVILVDMSPGTV